MKKRAAVLWLSIALPLISGGALARDGFDIDIRFPAPSVDVHVGAPSVYVDVEPPRRRHESVPPPRRGYDWRPGYWRWEGRRHVWTPGSWMPARTGSVWIADGWERDEHRWRYVPGHWEVQTRADDHDRDGWGRDESRDGGWTRSENRGGGWSRDENRDGNWNRDDRHDRDRRDDDWGEQSGQSFQVPPDRVPPRGSCRVWFRDLPPDRQSPPMSCGKARNDAREWGGMVIWARGPASFQDGRVLAEEFGRHRLYGVPPDRLPPPGACRVWHDKMPPDRQSPPESCASAERHARSEGGRVLYMPGSDMGY